MLKKKAVWIVLVLLAVATKLISLYPAAVEKYYSNGLYVGVSRIQRILFGWIPFSVGDILYVALVIYLLFRLVDMVKRMVRRQANRAYWWNGLKRLGFSVLLVYVVFNICWGLNYNRLGIAHQLQLPVQKVEKQDLAVVMEQLVDKLNYYDTLSRERRAILHDPQHVFRGAIQSYELLSKKNAVFYYAVPSIKSSLYSIVGNYLGYTGYYNPFTGESQLNIAVPIFTQPFTACHEIGHQLGYAKENEANFAGFLSARASADPNFLYAVYYEMYSYGRPFLYLEDSTALRSLDARLQPGIKKDRKELRDFYLKYESVVEKAVDKLYGQYLKANEQPNGKITYSEVILWLVAYYKKYGRDAL